MPDQPIYILIDTKVADSLKTRQFLQVQRGERNSIFSEEPGKVQLTTYLCWLNIHFLYGIYTPDDQWSKAQKMILFLAKGGL